MKNILFCTSVCNKNFEKCFFMYYFDCAETPKRTLKLQVDMLRNAIKLVFSIGLLGGIVAFLMLINVTFYKEKQNLADEAVEYIIVHDDYMAFSTNETGIFMENESLDNAQFQEIEFSILPKFFIPSQLSKVQLIVSHFLFALICLLISTQFHVETNMYEFFHKREDGTVLFESNANAITHYLSIYTGMIFKALGVSCIFLAIFHIVI